MPAPPRLREIRSCRSRAGLLVNPRSSTLLRCLTHLGRLKVGPIPAQSLINLSQKLERKGEPKRAAGGGQPALAAALSGSDGPGAEREERRVGGCHLGCPGMLLSPRYATEAVVPSPSAGESAAASSEGFLPQTGNVFLLPPLWLPPSRLLSALFGQQLAPCSAERDQQG